MFQQTAAKTRHGGGAAVNKSGGNMGKEQESASKNGPARTDNQPPSGKLWAPTAGKIPSAGITQPHGTKKESLGPNTKR